MKNTPKKVFILENGNYKELSYEDFCSFKENDISYADKLFIPLHGMLMEVTEETYRNFYKSKRRQKYIDERSAENNDFSYDMLTTDDFNGEDILADESEWSVIEDSHEAIISKIDFDSAQKVLKCDTRRSPGGKAVGLFSGMIFCGDCGASMVRKTVPAGDKKYVYYICSAHKQDKSCSPHRIRDNALEEIVLDSLKQHISEVVDMSELFAITDTAPLRTAQAQKVQRQLDKKHEEYEKLQKLLMSLYENLADGIIDREEYTRLKASFSARADEAEKQMDALREQLEDIYNHGTENAWMNEFIKRQGLTTLDRAVVVALIDKILIHSNDVVEIIYRWQDEFAWQLDILRSARLREVV